MVSTWMGDCLGIPGATDRWHSGKESPCSTACKRHGFHPCIGKIPWNRKWRPTPAFLPGKLHGQRSPWGCKESDTTEVTQNTHVNFEICPNSLKDLSIFFLSFTWIVNVTVFPLGIYSQFYMKSYLAERQVQPALEAEIMYVPVRNYPTGYWQGW